MIITRNLFDITRIGFDIVERVTIESARDFFIFMETNNISLIHAFVFYSCFTCILYFITLYYFPQKKNN